MPGDTTIIDQSLHSLSVLDSIQQHYGDTVRRLIDSLRAAAPEGENRPGPHYLLPEWGMLLVVIGILAFLYFIYVPGLDTNRPWYQRLILFNSGKILKEKGIQFDQWLKKYNPYYSALMPDQQERFMKRLLVFMQSKNFHYHDIKPQEIIPVLVSGAAVQLTFGLKNFMLDYFEDIHIIGKEYRIPGDDDIYYGHVSPKGIHVAWNYFLKGYEDYSDSVNVGLHEMAHALSFDCYLGMEDGADRKFKERLEEFSEKGKTVFRGMRRGESHLLSDYGTTNFDEFWAVSVESFFEAPAEFKGQLPELYRVMSELLNQDPLLPGKVVDPQLG